MRTRFKQDEAESQVNDELVNSLSSITRDLTQIGIEYNLKLKELRFEVERLRHGRS